MNIEFYVIPHAGEIFFTLVGGAFLLIPLFLLILGPIMLLCKGPKAIERAIAEHDRRHPRRKTYRR